MPEFNVNALAKSRILGIVAGNATREEADALVFINSAKYYGFSSSF